MVRNTLNTYTVFLIIGQHWYGERREGEGVWGVVGVLRE